MVPRLVQDLKAWNTSYPAASALSMIGGEAVLPVVAMLTNTAPNGLPYRWPFASGLQAASPADAAIVVPALVQALQYPEPEVQLYATQGLKKFRGHEREFVPAILRNLESQVSRVRMISIEVLGELGWKEAIPHLQRLQSDPDPHLRDAVKVALQRLER
jgi:HEAT repeats